MDKVGNLGKMFHLKLLLLSVVWLQELLQFFVENVCVFFPQASFPTVLCPRGLRIPALSDLQHTSMCSFCPLGLAQCGGCQTGSNVLQGSLLPLFSFKMLE